MATVGFRTDYSILKTMKFSGALKHAMLAFCHAAFRQPHTRVFRAWSTGDTRSSVRGPHVMT